MEAIVKKSEINGVVDPPPSKSYTHRAFISAALSPKGRIYNALVSEDTISTLRGCIKLGAEVYRGGYWEIRGVDEISSSGYFNFENSGTTLRIFTGVLSLSTSPYFAILDGDTSLRKRPNRELAQALMKLGAKLLGDEMFRPPIKVRGILKGGEIEIKAVSSQFVTSLLFSLPLARYESRIKILEIKSRPYIEISLHVLEKSGVKIDREGNEFTIYPDQRFNLRSFTVPIDFSSASYLIAAGLLAGKVVLNNVTESKQGDKRIVEICKEMGGNVEWKGEKIIAEKSELEGIAVDASDIPDLVPTIAVLGAVAKGKTRIYNAEHLRLKEIDRIEGIAKNLRSLGVSVKVKEDGLEISGGKREFKGTVDSFGDHRMALAFSLLGLLGEVKCKNAEVVSVSYPGFFDVLRLLGAEVEVRNI